MKYLLNIRWLKLVAILILILAIFLKSSEYFNFVRISIFIISIISINQYKKLNDIFMENDFSRNQVSIVFIISFSAIAVFFNPILPVYLRDTSLWKIIDSISILLFAVSYLADNSIAKGKEMRHIYSVAAKIYELKQNYCLTKHELYRADSSVEPLSSLYLNSEAIKLDPFDWFSYYKRASNYLSLQKLNSAINDYKTAISLGGTGKHFHLNLRLGILLLFEALNSNNLENEYEKIRQCFNNDLEEKENQVAYFFRAGIYLLRGGKADTELIKSPDVMDYFELHSSKQVLNFFQEKLWCYNINVLISIANQIYHAEKWGKLPIKKEDRYQLI